MPAYMLDTDTVGFALRGQGEVGSRLLAHRPSEVCISSITLAELRCGVEAKRSKRLAGLVDTFVVSVTVLAFDAEAADRFGPVATMLRRRGQPIGTFDTLVAAHALSRGLILVTKNSAHFQRVHGLNTESWL
jgi:tRNA(fMet)-specific endonuclease VapC